MNTFSDPQKIIDTLEIFPGQQVADLGSGSGAYSLLIAEKMKGSLNSRVFAVDIQKDLLERLTTEAQKKHLDSIHVIWGDIEGHKGTRLRDNSIDTVLLANTLFQVDHNRNTILEAHRILKTGGRLIVIDWTDSFGNIGPKEGEIVSQESAEALCKDVGFQIERHFDAGEHHYGFITHKV